MALTLPTCPRPVAFIPRLIKSENVMAPAFGGDELRVPRAGSKWAFDVTLDAMNAATAREWAAKLLAEGEVCRWTIPQPDLDVGTPGTVLVDGATQTGSTLNLKGFSASYAMKAGRWLSVTISSRLYLYMMRADGTANGSGNMAAPIQPMIRLSPGNNAAVNVAAPAIEGYVDLPDRSLEMLNRYRAGRGVLAGVSFTIRERG